MVDARVRILDVSHCRQLDALRVLRKGIYSNCESCTICVRTATRLAASDTRDERIFGHTWDWLLLSPPANVAQSEFVNQSRSMQRPSPSYPNARALFYFKPKKGFHSTRCRASFLPQTSSAPLFPLVSGTHQAIKVPSKRASPANTK